MNELVEIPLPGQPERTQMLQQYLMNHVIEPANNEKQRVTLGDDLAEVLNRDGGFVGLAGEMASKTEGMSGREIEKMCSNVYVSFWRKNLFWRFLGFGSIAGKSWNYTRKAGKGSRWLQDSVWWEG